MYSLSNLTPRSLLLPPVRSIRSYLKPHH